MGQCELQGDHVVSLDDQVKQAEIVLVATVQVGASLDQELGEHSGQLGRLGEIEEDKV